MADDTIGDNLTDEQRAALDAAVTGVVEQVVKMFGGMKSSGGLLGVGQGFAGGRLYPSGRYIMGEAGPEAISLHRGNFETSYRRDAEGKLVPVEVSIVSGRSRDA